MVRGDVCLECWTDMRASLTSLFTQGQAFCHECGQTPGTGEILSYLYRDSGAMILCEPCRMRFAPKIVSEVDAQAADKQAMVIKSVDAREEIARAESPYKKLTLWEQWRRLLG